MLKKWVWDTPVNGNRFQEQGALWKVSLLPCGSLFEVVTQDENSSQSNQHAQKQPQREKPHRPEHQEHTSWHHSVERWKRSLSEHLHELIEFSRSARIVGTREGGLIAYYFEILLLGSGPHEERKQTKEQPEDEQEEVESHLVSLLALGRGEIAPGR